MIILEGFKFAKINDDEVGLNNITITIIGHWRRRKLSKIRENWENKERGGRETRSIKAKSLSLKRGKVIGRWWLILKPF